MSSTLAGRYVSSFFGGNRVLFFVAGLGGEFEGELLDLLQVELAAAEEWKFGHLEVAAGAGKPKVWQPALRQLFLNLPNIDAIQFGVQDNQALALPGIRDAGDGADAVIGFQDRMNFIF